MKTAVIGGTGMNQWPGLEILESLGIETPYGDPSGPLLRGRWQGHEVLFCARHGSGHRIPPHAINYRANIWALREAGAETVVAISAVGGIHVDMGPSELAVPDDLIDYTWGRAHSYSFGAEQPLRHVEFTEPYSPALRAVLLQAARRAGVRVMAGGVMAVTQGPRLETAAEVRRLKRDGCDMIGMTNMPEAALAAELGLEYAALAVSVNWAAGIGRGDIHREIEQSMATGMTRVRSILTEVLSLQA